MKEEILKWKAKAFGHFSSADVKKTFAKTAQQLRLTNFYLNINAYI